MPVAESSLTFGVAIPFSFHLEERPGQDRHGKTFRVATLLGSHGFARGHLTGLLGE